MSVIRSVGWRVSATSGERRSRVWPLSPRSPDWVQGRVMGSGELGGRSEHRAPCEPFRGAGGHFGWSQRAFSWGAVVGNTRLSLGSWLKGRHKEEEMPPFLYLMLGMRAGGLGDYLKAGSSH